MHSFKMLNILKFADLELCKIDLPGKFFKVKGIKRAVMRLKNHHSEG